MKRDKIRILESIQKQDKVNSADSASKSMVRLARAEKLVLSALVFARKIARMIFIQNIGFDGSPDY